MRSFLKLAGIFLLLVCTGLSFAETNVSGTISTNTVWDLAGSPYNVTNDVTVAGGNSLATLTVEAGVEVRFYPAASLIIGGAASAVTDGKLVAQGTAANPITFTTFYDGTNPVNIWRSIYFNDKSDDSSILDQCVLEYGITAFIVTNANPTIQNSVIRDFTDNALHIYENASPVLTGSNIENVKSAMIVSNKGTGTPEFSNNAVDNCAEFGVKINGPDAMPLIYDNSFSNVTEYIVFVYPEQLGGLWGNTQVDNNPKKSMVYVTGGEVTQDATWQETGIVLFLSNNVFVKGSGGSLVTLTLNSDLNILFEEHKGLYIGSTNEQEPTKLMASGVTFGSVRETVDPTIPIGFWYAIHFDASADDASVVDGCTFEDSQHAIWVSGSSPTFTNNTVTNCLNNGVYIKDTASPTVTGNNFDTMPSGVYLNNTATGTPVISSNTIENCSNIAIRVEGPTALPTISDNVFNGNETFLVDLYPNQANNLTGSSGSDNRADFNLLRIKASDYTISGSWDESEIPYFVSGNVFIKAPGTPVLTIGDNAILQFDTNSGLYVGSPVGGDPGKLIAFGATFTSRNATPAAGDWSSVIFDSTADASSSLDNCIIEYATSGVSVFGSTPTISNCTFDNILTNGVYMNKNSAPTISGNSFTNLPTGVFISLKSTATPTISGNTFDALADIPIVTNGPDAAPVISDNTFMNLTTYLANLSPNQAGNMSGSIASDNDPQFNHINVRPGVMTQSSSWSETQVGYFLAGDVAVAGDGAQVTLDVDEGVGVYFFRNTGLWIGSSVAANSAKLVANQATFTTFDLNDPDPGEWSSIYFYDNASDESSLNGCTIEYANNGLDVNNVSLDVTNSTFSNLQGTAINVTGNSDLSVMDNTFDTMNIAIRYNTAAVGALDIQGNVFSNVADNVIIIKDNAVMPTISGNAFTDNNNYLVLLFPDDAKYFTGNTYDNNRLNQIYIQRGFITEDAVWGELGVVYYIFDDVFVEGADGMATLTVEPGVELYFNNNADLVVGSSLNGALAKGTNKTTAGEDATGKLLAKGVTFTSANQFDPAPGAWSGITFDVLANDSSKITRSTIEYATNGVRVNDTHAFIEINSFMNNLENNVYCYGGSPTVMYNDLIGAKRGVYVVLEGNPVINYNNIESSTLFGVENTSDVNTVDAENNWWGRVSGPAGLGPGAGSSVSDMVDFDPFLTEAFVPVFPPMAFSLLTPANGAVLNTGDILVDWEDALEEDPGDSVTYTLMISLSETFEAAFTVEIPGIPVSEYLWNHDLILNTPVYWKVKAVDTNTEGTFSNETFMVTIEVLPPADFTLLTPTDGDTTTETTVEFTWEETTNSELGGALTYTFTLATNADFTDAEEVAGLTGTSYEKVGLEEDMQYYWKVKAVDENSDGKESTDVFMLYVQGPTDIEDGSSAVPTEFSMSQNYPNPFNPVTSIKYGIPAASNVKVTVHNSLGQEIATLVDGFQKAGYYTVLWNASNYGSGVYFYRIQAGDFHSVKKAVLTK